MKKCTFLIPMAIYASIGSLYGQDITKRVQDLENKTITLQQQQEAALKLLNETNAQVKRNSTGIKNTLNQNTNSDEVKIQRTKDVLTTSSEFIKSSAKSFSTIDVSLIQSSFLQEIINLNNPTNNDLGFSLREIITKLIEKHITSKDKSLNKANRVNNFVNSILNSPITKILKSAVPSINAVVSFVSNISFGSKKIREEDFDAFIKDLYIYTNHYERLASSTNDFQKGLEQLRIQAKSMEMILEDYVEDRVFELYRDKDMVAVPHDISSLYAHYEKEQILEQINKLVSVEHNNDLTLAAKDVRLTVSTIPLTQAIAIQDALEILTNQYVNTYKSYLNEVIKVLEDSKTLEGANKEKIDQKITYLNEQIDFWSKKFIDLIDVKDLKKKTKILNDLLIW